MSRRVQVRNSLLNLGGGILPGLLGILLIPKIVGLHSVEFFGIYMLQVALLYVLSLTDLGVSRAMAIVVYDKSLNPDRSLSGPFTIATSFVRLISLIGGAGIGAIVIVAALFGVMQGADLITSSLLLVLSASVSVNTLPMRAILELEGRFLTLNAIRSISALTIYVAPVLVNAGNDWVLTTIAIVLLGARVSAFIVYRLTVSASVSSVDIDQLSVLRKVMLQKSKWIGVTNLASLGLTYIDRYLAAFLTTVSTVAYYTMATEVSSKIWLVTGAILSAVNPIIAREYFDGGTAQLKSLIFPKLVIYVMVVTPAIVLAFLAEPLVEMWLGENFNHTVSDVLFVLIAGICVNSLSQLNFSLLQLSGGEKEGAFLQIYGLIVLSILAVIFVPVFGIIGVALAFSARLTLDALYVSFLVASRQKSAGRISSLELLSIPLVFALVWAFLY